MAIGHAHLYLSHIGFLQGAMWRRARSAYTNNGSRLIDFDQR